MVDVAHGINSILVCLQEATSKITRSMSSSLKYLESKQAAKQNRRSTSEREAILEKPEEDTMKRLAFQDSRHANFPWELPCLLLMATLVAGVSYSSGVLRVTYLRSYKALNYFITAFVHSNVIVSIIRWWIYTLGIFCSMILISAVRRYRTLAISALLAQDCGKKVASEAPKHVPVGQEPKLLGRHLERLRLMVAFLHRDIMLFLFLLKVQMSHGHCFCSRALRVCTRVAQIGLTGAISIWSSRSLTAAIFFSALAVAVLLCIGLQVLAFLPMSLLVATFTVTVYQAELKQPGGIWQGNGTDDRHHYRALAGDPTIPHSKYPGKFFFYAAAFVWLVVVLILVHSYTRSFRGILYTSKVAKTRDLPGQIGAYAGGSCRSMRSSLKYLQSKQAAEQNNRTREREAISEKPEETKPLSCQDSREGNIHCGVPIQVLRMATLAFTGTYSSGGSPPFGIWYDNHGGHLADGHVVQATYLQLYRAFFYYFITALVACIFIISNLRWWLCTLGVFCIMVAISGLFAPDGGKKVASETPETLEGVRWRLVMVAALVAVVSYLGYHYQDRLSRPDVFLLDMLDGDEYLPGPVYPMLRAGRPEHFKMAFLCFNSMASLVIILMLLTTRTVTRHFDDELLWAFRICTSATVIGLTGAFAIWGSESLMTSFWFSAFMITILFCIGLQVLAFLLKALADLIPDPQATIDSDKHRHMFRNKLLLLGILAASITYQAGLEPPGGYWQENATDGLHHHRSGDPHTIYPLAFFYCNATVFAASLVTLVLLLSNICRTQGIKYCALQVAMTLDLLGLIGAYATGCCSESDPVVNKDDPNSQIKHTPLEATWRVSCSAPHHMTGNLSLLLTGSYMPVQGGNDGDGVFINSTNGEAVPLRVRGSGSVRTESITLYGVWYVPGLDSNLVSTGQLARQGCAVNLGPGGCRITRGDALVGTARFTEACQFELDFLKVA